MRTYIKTFLVLLIITAVGLIYSNVQNCLANESVKSNVWTVKFCIYSGPSVGRQIEILNDGNCSGSEAYATCITGDDGCCEAQFIIGVTTYSARVVATECPNPCTYFVPANTTQVNLIGDCP